MRGWAPRRAILWVGAAAALDLVGGAVAKRHGLVGEPLLIRAPGLVPDRLTTALWGTALSGPLVVDGVLIALVPAAAGGVGWARRALQMGGWLRLAGVLAEPITWGRRPPRWTMALEGAHLLVASRLAAPVGVKRQPEPGGRGC